MNTQPNFALLEGCQKALPHNAFCLSATVLLLALDGQPSTTTSTRENPYWHVADAVTRRRSGYPLPITPEKSLRWAKAFNYAAKFYAFSAPDLVALTNWQFLRDTEPSRDAVIARAARGVTYSSRLAALSELAAIRWGIIEKSLAEMAEVAA